MNFPYDDHNIVRHLVGVENCIYTDMDKKYNNVGVRRAEMKDVIHVSLFFSWFRFLRSTRSGIPFILHICNYPAV